MSKSKKFISLLLSITMMFSLAVPAFAAETEMQIPPAISAKDMQISGNFTDIDQLGNATYYVQKTDNYTVANVHPVLALYHWYRETLVSPVITTPVFFPILNYPFFELATFLWAC